MAENRVQITVTASGAAEAQKILDSVAKAGGQIGSIGTPAIKQAEQALASFGGTARRVFEVFAGVNLAHIFEQGLGAMKAFVAETATLGLEAKVQEDAFARLSKSVGVAGDALVAQMNKAAGGILNTSDVMIAAAKALNQSLQPDQIVNLMTIARQQSKLAGIDVADAFNQITQAIANQQPRALKQLGIVIDMDEAFKKHAATLGVEVTQLTELGKTQAIYNAVADQTTHSVAALTGEVLTQSEQIQKLSAAWKQAKEDIGKVVVDVGFELLAWIQSIAASIPNMSQSLAQFGVIWQGVWGGAVAAVEPVARILIDVFLPTLKLAGVAATAFGVGMNAGFSVIAGPLAFVASLIDDLARNKWPSLTRANLEANVATAEARVRLAESVTAMQNLATGTTATSVATKDMAAATAMGANSLGAMANVVKPLEVDVKALSHAMGGLSQTMTEFAKEGGLLASLFPPSADEQMLAKMTKAIEDARSKFLETKGMTLDSSQVKAFDAGAEAIKKWAENLMEQVRATREAKEESDAFYKALPEQLDAAGKSYDAVRAKATAALEAMIPDEIKEAQEFYRNLAINIDASAQSYEAIQTPLDDAARASQAYLDTLEGIDRSAQLLGKSYDPLPAKINAVTQEIIRLGAAGQDVTALQQHLADLRQVEELRGIFKGVFDSIGSSINSVVQGVLMGTQTMAEAWSNLWRSIVIGFINSGIQKLIKWIGDSLWNALFGGGSSGSGDLLGSLISGIGKLFGSSSSSTTNVATSAVDALNGVGYSATTVSKGLDLFGIQLSDAIKVIGGVVALGASVYGLITAASSGSKGGLALSAAGTVYSAYSLASTIASSLGSTLFPSVTQLLTAALAALSPTLSASISATAASISASVASTLTAALGPLLMSEAAAASPAVASGSLMILDPGIIFAGMLMMGAIAGQMEEMEQEMQMFREVRGSLLSAQGAIGALTSLFTKLGTATTAANLPGTLSKVAYALQSLPDLAFATATASGAASRTAWAEAIPKWRAEVGAITLAVLDAQPGRASTLG